MTLESTLIRDNSERMIEQIRRGIKPEGISQDIFEYATRTMQLEDIFKELIREYCAGRCDNGPIGCCNYNAYHFDIPDEMLILQEIEAISNGWIEPDKNGCRYHSLTGCDLTLFRPPPCINSICDQLEKHIRSSYSEDGEIFIQLLRKANRYGLKGDYNETKNLLQFMDLAISQGKKLVEMTKGGKCL